MHLRISTVRRGDKTYRYAQLVESYRREQDGRPAHRILASLGTLTDEAIANLRLALEATRTGEALVVPPRAVAVAAKPVVRANYRFLDVAVLLRIWKESGVAGLLADLLADPASQVPADQVIAALVLHRCVDPGSKLAAWRWFPTTALPELLPMSTGQFNNSRVHRALEGLELVDATLQAACEASGATAVSIAQAGESLGFERPRDDRLLLDLGVFDKARPRDGARLSWAVAAMRIALECEGKTPAERSALAKDYGISLRTARRYRELLGLEEPLQLRVLAGHADTVSQEGLLAIASTQKAKQQGAFEAAVAAPGRLTHTRVDDPDLQPLRTRGVLYFNPRRFLEKRDADTKNLKAVAEKVAEQNKRLAVAGNQRTDASALAAAHTQIVRVGLGAVLSPRLETREGLRQVALDLDEAAWARRRKVDGVAILVSHPDLTVTPAALVDLYFEKDVVEKDFQSIKSAIEVRPIHHRTDVKLRAHVTVCMLALLLQRVLRERLKASASQTSAAAALETLATAHLNLVSNGKADFYTLTSPTEPQHSLLAALTMEDLARDDWVAKNITPR